MDPLTRVCRRFVKHFDVRLRQHAALEVVHGDKNSLAFPTMITARFFRTANGGEKRWKVINHRFGIRRAFQNEPTDCGFTIEARRSKLLAGLHTFRRKFTLIFLESFLRSFGCWVGSRI